ncbi:nitroreductase family deazaflavin-dependent oxidoreductase [Aquipuribacter sp. MA13-6]|uniref:nitroreductase family deazaflavin-dependent oxidoreductase n=1 Tax=unclassified Aquipuribacter TaxID=2635084 RepID=UPI003EE95D91
MSVMRALAAVVAAVVGLVLLWLVGMRDKDSTVVRVQRRINRDHMNVRVRGTAGTPGSTTALVRHTGRRSGRTYETPVDAVRTSDGFVVAMVYGPDTDWVRNVVAGGPATVVHDGTEHRVLTAAVADVDEVADAFTPSQRRVGRVFGIRQALVVRTARAGG